MAVASNLLALMYQWQPYICTVVSCLNVYNKHYYITPRGVAACMCVYIPAVTAQRLQYNYSIIIIS